MKLRDHFDIASLIIILITVILFGVALFVHGFTHDMLLEAAVFLISVKLILSSYKSSVTIKRLEEKLDELLRR